jgi:large repetitive protein
MLSRRYGRLYTAILFLIAFYGTAWGAGTITPPAYPPTPDASTTTSLTMTLSQAPADGLTVTPSGVGVTFTPSVLTFNSGQTSASFTVTVGASTGPSAVTITYTLGGTDSAQYTVPSPSVITPLGIFLPPTYPITTQDGQTTGSLTVSASFAPPESVTLTPSAPGLTFNPSSLTFTTTSQSFTVTAGPSAGPGPITVSYAVGGTNQADYVAPVAATFTALGKFTPPTYPNLAPGSTSSSLTMSLSVVPPTSVTITPSGTGLTFSPSTLSFTSTSTETFTVTAAANAGPGSVSINYGIGGADSAKYAAPAQGSINIAATPTVSSISPTSGPAAGGTTVSITGTNLASVSAVQFGGVAARSFSYVGGNTVTAVSPAGTGTVDITVTTPGGTSATSAADRFTYAPVPAVTSVSPSSGPAAGGTVVTITGSGFLAVAGVQFGATAATSFTLNSATSITATSPSGAGTVDVTVTALGGTSATSAADRFLYTDVTTATALFVNPESGTDTGVCPQTAPCATLNYALAEAPAGATISIENGGTFGPIYITQPVTIDGPADGTASIVWSSTPPGCVGGIAGSCNGNAAASYAVEIVAGASSVVELNNLVIDNGAGSNGAMHIASAASVGMRGSALRGGTGSSPQLLLMDSSQGSLMQLMFTNCDVGPNAAGGGIFLHPSSPASLNINGGQVHNLTFGVKLNATSLSSGSSVNAAIDSTTLFGFDTNAIVVVATSGGSATASVSRSTISQSTDDVLYVDGSTATALLYDNVITASNAGVNNASSGASVTFGNNDIYANTTNVGGNPLSAAPAGAGGKTQ